MVNHLKQNGHRYFTPPANISVDTARVLFTARLPKNDDNVGWIRLFLTDFFGDLITGDLKPPEDAVQAGDRQVQW